jgi:hypothetical protein
MRTDAGCLAAQLRHGAAMDKIVARGHLGDHKADAESGREPSKGCIGDARHGRQKNPVGERNIAYFQRLRP